MLAQRNSPASYSEEPERETSNYGKAKQNQERTEEK
jgi:hypothetical protein